MSMNLGRLPFLPQPSTWPSPPVFSNFILVRWYRGQSSGVGRFRDGLTTKIHTLADALGRPPRFIVTAGLGGRRHPSSGPARKSGRFAPGSATAPHGVTPEFRRAFLGGEPRDADQENGSAEWRER